MPKSDLPEGFSAFVREYDMLPPGSAVVCAVSGGADSVCLLHLLSRYEGITLTAAHYNHQLRGEASDADEAFVRRLCQEWRIPLTVGRGDVSAQARRLGQGTEEAARLLRYTFLTQTAMDLGAAAVATAHNANDNAETVLLHLLRGSGLHGLTGIAPVRSLSPSCSLVRPLLTTPRSHIERYLEQHGLPHAEDLSNAEDTYARNRVRHRLLPLMEEMNPGFVDRLTETIPRLRREDEYLNAQTLSALRRAHWEDEDRLVIPVEAVAALPPALAPRCVRQLLERIGEPTGCRSAHLEAVTALCRGNSPSGRVHLPHGLTARREYGLLVLTHLPPPSPFAPFPLGEGENPIPDTPWTVRLEGSPWPGLVVRSRRQGDTLTLPNGHSRSLKRLLIDRKIPRLERERVPIVADDDGVIAAAGLGPNLSHPCHRQVSIYREDGTHENHGNEQ